MEKAITQKMTRKELGRDKYPFKPALTQASKLEFVRALLGSGDTQVIDFPLRMSTHLE